MTPNLNVAVELTWQAGRIVGKFQFAHSWGGVLIYANCRAIRIEHSFGCHRTLFAWQSRHQKATATPLRIHDGKHDVAIVKVVTMLSRNKRAGHAASSAPVKKLHRHAGSTEDASGSVGDAAGERRKGMPKWMPSSGVATAKDTHVFPVGTLPLAQGGTGIGYGEHIP